MPPWEPCLPSSITQYKTWRQSLQVQERKGSGTPQMSCSVAGVALPPCAVGRAGVGVQSMKATPHPTRHALILSAHQPIGRVPDHPPPGILCQLGHPTHLGGKVLPTDSVLRAVRVILVPPVQVQLRGIVAGPEALELHVLGQFHLHCREGRGSLQSPGQLGAT